jgi:hypothetical protein
MNHAAFEQDGTLVVIDWCRACSRLAGTSPAISSD